jgi:hypothetical protein
MSSNLRSSLIKLLHGVAGKIDMAKLANMK